MSTNMGPDLHLLRRTSLLLLLISVCMMPALVGAAHLSNETDRQALLAFKDQISKDPHNALSSWNTSLHFCHWHGVSCSRSRSRRHQRVTALNLSTLGLEGRLSPHVANLSFLRHISLTNNSFHEEIPQELGRLFRLLNLNLQYNSLEGAIPASLSNCSKLRFMYLSYNKLVGEVPPELGFLSNLTIVSLGRNNFTGIFPPFIMNLSSLARLSIAANNFHGEIPKDGFVGSIPNNLGHLQDLNWVNFGNNELRTENGSDLHFIASLNNCSRLDVLSVENNQLYCPLPASISDAGSSKEMKEQ